MSDQTKTILEMAGRAAVAASRSDRLPSGWAMGMRAVGGILAGVTELLEDRTPDELVAELRQLADQELPRARDTASAQDAAIDEAIRRRFPNADS